MDLLFKLRTGKTEAETMKTSQIFFYKAAGTLRKEDTIHMSN